MVGEPGGGGGGGAGIFGSPCIAMLASPKQKPEQHGREIEKPLRQGEGWLRQGSQGLQKEASWTIGDNRTMFDHPDLGELLEAQQP